MFAKPKAFSYQDCFLPGFVWVYCQYTQLHSDYATCCPMLLASDQFTIVLSIAFISAIIHLSRSKWQN